MAKISEHYIRARCTSNLKSDPLTLMSASDVLGAAGMAGQNDADAMLLWSICYGGKSGEKLALVELLAVKLANHMARHKAQGNPKRITEEVLAYYMVAKCHHCDGTGHKVIEGTITRHETPCTECMGTGKPQQPNGAAFDWLLRYVEQLMSVADGRMRQKIGASV